MKTKMEWILVSKSSSNLFGLHEGMTFIPVVVVQTIFLLCQSFSTLEGGYLYNTVFSVNFGSFPQTLIHSQFKGCTVCVNALSCEESFYCSLTANLSLSHTRQYLTIQLYSLKVRGWLKSHLMTHKTHELCVALALQRTKTMQQSTISMKNFQ